MESIQNGFTSFKISAGGQKIYAFFKLRIILNLLVNWNKIQKGFKRVLKISWKSNNRFKVLQNLSGSRFCLVTSRSTCQQALLHVWPFCRSSKAATSISNLTGQSFTRVILLYSSFIIKISSLQQSTSETVSRYVNKYSAVQVYFDLVAFNDPSYEFFVSLSTSLLPFYRTFSYL